MQEVINHCVANWHLTQVKPYQETPSSVLLEAVYQDQSVILKCFKPGSDEQRGTLALQHYAGNGSVRMLHNDETAVLLPKIKPGTTLNTELGTVSNDVQIFCDIVSKLHQQPIDSATATALPSIAALGKTFATYLEQSRQNQAQPVPRGIVERAQAIFSSLCATQGRQVVLHGDLHHFNILFDERHGWLAIDPKGYIGEPEAEISPFLRNPLGSPTLYSTEHIIRHRIEVISDHLQLNQERVLLWFYCLSVLSVLYQSEQNLKYDEWGALVLLLDGMVD